MSQPAAVSSASFARSSPRCQPWSSRPRLPSGWSRLWSGPATKPSSEIDMWQVVFDMSLLSDPLVDPDVHRVAGLLADGLAQGRADREPVRAVALGHERAVERLAVDRAADLHEPAGVEELRHVVHHDARPCAGVVASLKLRAEFGDHAHRTLPGPRN